MVESEPQQDGPVFEVIGQDGVRGEGPFMIIHLKAVHREVQEESHQEITDASYETYGCPSAMRCGTWVTRWVIGRKPEQVAVIDAEDLTRVVGGLPLGKEHCAALAVNALRDALKQLSQATSSRSIG